MQNAATEFADRSQSDAVDPGDGRRLVYLCEEASARERSILRQWIESNTRGDRNDAERAVEIVTIPSPRRRSSRRKPDVALEGCLNASDDPSLVPMRLAWLPRETAAKSGRLGNVVASLLFGDPYEPGRLRQWYIQKFHPDRCKVIQGESAPLGELRRRWQQRGGMDRSETGGLGEFVARQATITLERAERRLRGMRYKVPRFVHESILARPAFRAGIAALARDTGADPHAVANEARKCLREIAATHSPHIIDLTSELSRLMYRRAYGERVNYDHDQLETVYALAQRHPVVLLPSHKSNLDHLILQSVLYENGHPPNHTAGGINMNFFPVGPLMRRSGVFFIRRTFKGQDVYRFVLGQYIDYLIEKRFPLEWYIEGGRSRSGKLLPPRFGLLAYVVDAYRRAKSEDVVLIPVSIAYDQIQDIGSYVSEQQGGEKETESFGWALKMYRSLRRRYGGIHLRLGEPLSLRDIVGGSDPSAPSKADDRSVELRKIAFEVAVRINRVTPITPTSLVTMALLGAADRAMTLPETLRAVDEFVGYAQRRDLPFTQKVTLADQDAVRATLEGLIENAVVSCFDEGPEPVYQIRAQQHLTAAYYRNTIIHFFVNAAIAELALVRAAEPDVADPRSVFFEESLRLRDLLKFEFFFSDKDAFQEEMRRELAAQDSSWDAALGGGGDAVRGLVERFTPYTSHLVLRPFLESYRVVGDVLSGFDEEDDVREVDFLRACLGLGKQYALQKRIRNAESVSKEFFKTGLSLARNRKLTEVGAGDLRERRTEFAREIGRAVRRVDLIDAMAAARRAAASS